MRFFFDDLDSSEDKPSLQPTKAVDQALFAALLDHPTCIVHRDPVKCVSKLYVGPIELSDIDVHNIPDEHLREKLLAKIKNIAPEMSWATTAPLTFMGAPLITDSTTATYVTCSSSDTTSTVVPLIDPMTDSDIF